MKLHQGGGDLDFPKFKKIGDNVRGTFLSFTDNVTGKFGQESVLILKSEDGKRTLSVRCPATLAKAVRENLALFVDGAFVDIKMIGEKPSRNFPQPMKLFDVDIEPPGHAPPPVAADAVPAAEDDSIPF